MCVASFRHLKLELLTQLPASNDGKYLYLLKKDIAQIALVGRPNIFQLFSHFQWHFILFETRLKT